MRRTLLAGVLLAVAAVLVVLVSSTFGLELESVALLGWLSGRWWHLVPDRSPAVRLGGFAAGFVIAWIGYLAARRRCSRTPPAAVRSRSGLVVLLCVGVTAVSRGRIPLWSTLLGAAALSGAYEFTFAAAPPEVVTTSMSTATALLFNVAVGFLVVALVAPPEAAGPPRPVARRDDDVDPTPEHEETTHLDEFMMEKTK